MAGGPEILTEPRGGVVVTACTSWAAGNDPLEELLRRLGTRDGLARVVALPQPMRSVASRYMAVEPSTGFVSTRAVPVA
jgi:hypothetical protein